MKHLFIAGLFFASVNAQGAKLVSIKARQYLPVFGLGSTSSVAYTGAGGSSFQWNPVGGGDTVLLRIFTTTAAHIKVAASPTASAADPILPANTEWILEVPAGSKVGAVPVSTSGLLYSSELITYPSND